MSILNNWSQIIYPDTWIWDDFSTSGVCDIFVMELDTTDILIGKASKLLLLFWKQIWSKFYVIKHYLIVHELSSWPYPYLLIVFPKNQM